MKKLLAFYILASFAAYADETADLKKAEEARKEWTKQYFEKQGLPAPDGGTKIVPAKTMKLDPKKTAYRLKLKEQMNSIGYINKLPSGYKQLMNIKSVSKETLILNSVNYGPKDDQIQGNIELIHMAYPFTGAKESNAVRVIGYAPSGSYTPEEGWSGAVQFFELKDVGVCHYSENNLKFSHGSIILAEEDILRDINGKATTIEITGQKNQGFIYNIEWYDNAFFKQLECASPVYSPDITSKLITLAKIIDKS